MELRQLEYLVAVARHLHFTRAADELHLAQPALSQQIARLERELGVQLLDRAHHRVRLTPAGEAMLIHAQRILADVERCHEEMRAYAGALRGRVCVGALPFIASVHLPGIIARFHALHPHVELVVREDVTEQLSQMLAAGQIDCALLHTVDTGLPASLARASVTTERIFTEDIVLVVAPGHPLAGQVVSEMAALRGEPFIAFKAGAGLRQALVRAGQLGEFAPRVASECGDLGTIRGLVAAGMGISLLPRSVAELPGPPTVIVPFVPARLQRTVLLAWPDDRQRGPAAQSWLDFLRADVAAHPWHTNGRLGV